MARSTPTARKDAARRISGDGWSRVGTSAKYADRNRGDALNAECMRIATGISAPDELKQNAITSESPVRIRTNWSGLALLQ
jgi:hypothetical protein